MGLRTPNSPRPEDAEEEWSEWGDSNSRPPAPEAGALPGCATLRLDEVRYIDGGTKPRKETRDLRCPWRAMLLGGHPLTI
jgi:hypothetical protein